MKINSPCIFCPQQALFQCRQLLSWQSSFWITSIVFSVYWAIAANGDEKHLFLKRVNLGVKNVWIGSTIGFYTPFCQVHSHWIYLRNNNWLFCSCLLSMNGVIVRCKTREKHTPDPSEVGQYNVTCYHATGLGHLHVLK